MSEAKHTPGPWQLLPEECHRSYIRVRGTILGGRYKVANVLSPAYENVHEREACETRANARLIAAAPELLEALIDVLTWMDAPDESAFSDSQLAKARAAIAKATSS